MDRSRRYVIGITTSVEGQSGVMFLRYSIERVVGEGYDLPLASVCLMRLPFAS